MSYDYFDTSAIGSPSFRIKQTKTRPIATKITINGDKLIIEKSTDDFEVVDLKSLSIVAGKVNGILLSKDQRLKILRYLKQGAYV